MARATIVETIESGSQIYEDLPNPVAGESGVDMARPQLVGDKDVENWMTPNGPAFKRQKLARGELVSLSE